MLYLAATKWFAEMTLIVSSVCVLCMCSCLRELFSLWHRVACQR